MYQDLLPTHYGFKNNLLNMVSELTYRGFDELIIISTGTDGECRSSRGAPDKRNRRVSKALALNPTRLANK